MLKQESANFNPVDLNALADVSYKPIPIDVEHFDDEYLKLSFNYCQQIIKHHSKTFNLASSLLDPTRRDAIAALYSFCRLTDDIIDKDIYQSKEILGKWQSRANSIAPDLSDPVQFAWLYTRMKFKIPAAYMDQLIKGVLMDPVKKRYQTFEELKEYCYYVASTVGLMSMHIIGFSDKSAIPFAINMGVALQLTNIIRDVGEDYRMGRIYIPQEDLDRFNITDAHFENNIIDQNWKDLMTFQIERTRALYDSSWSGLCMLEPKGKWAIESAAKLYREILKMVEFNNFDNLSKRAFVRKRRKLLILSKMLST